MSKTKGIWGNGAESTNVVIVGYSLISVAVLRIYIDSPFLIYFDKTVPPQPTGTFFTINHIVSVFPFLVDF